MPWALVVILPLLAWCGWCFTANALVLASGWKRIPSAARPSFALRIVFYGSAIALLALALRLIGTTS